MRISFRLVAAIIAALSGTAHAFDFTIDRGSVNCSGYKATLTVTGDEYLDGTYALVDTYLHSGDSTPYQRSKIDISQTFYISQVSTKLSETFSFTFSPVAQSYSSAYVRVTLTDASGTAISFTPNGAYDPDQANFALSIACNAGGSSTVPTSTRSSSSTYPTSSSTTSTAFTSTRTTSTSPTTITTPTPQPVTYTTSSTSTSSSSSTHTDPALPTPSPRDANVGAIAGGVVGGVAVLAAIILLYFCVCVKRRKRSGDGNAFYGANILERGSGDGASYIDQMDYNGAAAAAARGDVESYKEPSATDRSAEPTTAVTPPPPPPHERQSYAAPAPVAKSPKQLNATVPINPLLNPDKYADEAKQARLSTIKPSP